MISSLRGTVLATGTDHVVIEVGGVGFFVHVPATVGAASTVGEQRRLHTSLVVREDALTLFGFDEPAELEVFGQLLSVTGVGPKSALGVLGHLTVAQIAQAVAADDDAPFRRVSGIGPKTAKLIVVQLAGKLEHLASVSVTATHTPGGASDTVTQVVTALIGLGWSDKVATQAARDTADEHGAESVGALLRLTLAALGPAAGGASRG